MVQHFNLTKTEIHNLFEFMYEAHLNTYAASRELNLKYQLNPPKNKGHIEYLFKRGAWEYHDSYIGEINVPGKEIIYYKDMPVWAMAYQSTIITKDPEIVIDTYNFLKKALQNCSPETPFRGPSEFEDGYFLYTFIINKGDYKNFCANEKIYYKGQEIYTNNIIGGVILS